MADGAKNGARPGGWHVVGGRSGKHPNKLVYYLPLIWYWNIKFQG